MARSNWNPLNWHSNIVDGLSTVITGSQDGLFDNTSEAGRQHIQNVNQQEDTKGQNPDFHEIKQHNRTAPGKRDSGIYTWPIDMPGDIPYILFKSRPSGGIGEGIIGLPMPQNINFQDQAQYGSANTGAIERGLADIEGFMKKLKEGILGAAKDFGKGALDTLSGTQAAMRTLGVAYNPNVITEFSSMGTRRFNFQYKFMPRNAEESVAIRNIQYMFQLRAYPTVSIENSVLKYPPKWTITYGNSNLPGLHECYLENVGFTVNPSANTWHMDGAPGEVDLSLSFIETKALTAEDIIFKQKGSTNLNDKSWGQAAAAARAKPTVPGTSPGTGGGRNNPAEGDPSIPVNSDRF